MSEDTKRWTTDPGFLEAERERARGYAREPSKESSALRRRPPPPPSTSASGPRPISLDVPPAAMPVYVDVVYVRALYDEFTRVVGPIAKTVFEAELRALRRLPSMLSARDYDFLVERLTARIPVASARARFLAATHDLFN